MWNIPLSAYCMVNSKIVVYFINSFLCFHFKVEISNGLAGSEQLRRTLSVKYNIRIPRYFLKKPINHFLVKWYLKNLWPKWTLTYEYENTKKALYKNDMALERCLLHFHHWIFVKMMKPQEYLLIVMFKFYLTKYSYFVKQTMFLLAMVTHTYSK